MSIIKEVGQSYFSGRFAGAMFFTEDGAPAVLPSREGYGLSAPMFTVEGAVRAFLLTGSAEKATKKEVLISPDFFDDMNKVSVPALGYRTAAEGRVLMYISRPSRVYRKGVCADTLETSFAVHSRQLFEQGSLSQDYYSRPLVKATMVMKPEFLSLREGVAAMNEGRIMSFALSSNTAVVPTDDNHYNILNNEAFIGTVNRDGNVRLVINATVEDLT